MLKSGNRMIISVILAGMLLLCCGCTDRASDAEVLLPETVSGDLETVQPDREEKPAEKNSETAEEAFCTVYVCGAVMSPGVYSLPQGSRIYEALNAAGGLCAEADQVFLNQAELLTDGQQIYVPTEEEAETLKQAGDTGTKTDAEDGKINLNTASREELMTLPGIGEAKADSILDYRKEHGRFTSIEELMQIPGIKEGIFAKLKDSITAV